jgi:hypothetical protein
VSGYLSLLENFPNISETISAYFSLDIRFKEARTGS